MDAFRLCVHAAAVLALSGVASAFTRHRAVAVLAGTATALGLFLLFVSDSPPAALPGVVASLGAGAGLLAAVWLGRLVRRRSQRATDPAESISFVRHWRGEGTLRAAGGRALSLAAALGYAFLTLDRAPMHVHPRVVAGAIVAAWALALVLVPWLLVGLWRVAGARVARGGSRLVGWPVKLVALAGGLLLLPVAAFEAAPDLKEYGPIALGPPEREKYAIRLLRGGAELELSGELGWGAGADLERALVEHPAVRVVHLDSGGGYVFEGARIGASIRKRKLSTYVAHHCESACVRAFAAGEERWISRRAIIGLHRPVGHRSARADLRRTADELTRYLEARGIDRAVGERGAVTPAAKMWRPDHDELFRSRLATRYARADEVALSGFSERDVERLDLLLRENAFHQVLFEFERPVFERVVAAMREGIRDGKAESEVLGFLDAEVARLLERDLPRTSDAAAHGFYQAFLEAARHLRARSPRECAAWIEAEGRAAPALPPRVESRLLEAVAKVVAAAALEPMPAPDERAVAAILFGVMAAASARDEDLDVLDEDGAAARRPDEYCAAAIAIAEEIVALPPSRAGPVVRHLTRDEL